MKKVISLTLALILLLCAAGCGNEAEPAETGGPEVTEALYSTVPVTAEPTATPAPTPAPTPTPTPAPTPEPTEPPYRNPFNGEGMDKPYSGRPFTVMINNISNAFPHRGVSEADLLYEALAEGGITRMVAVFSDVESVGEIGPVRSIRPYFIDLGLSYNAVICHAGGSTAAYNRLYGGGIAYIDGLTGYSFTAFYRDQQRIWDGYATEHTLFTKGEYLHKIAAEEKKYNLEVPDGYETGLHFVTDGTPEDGESAKTIEVSFGSKTTDLTYDAAIGLYAMKEFGKDYIDETTKEKVYFRNVLAIRAQTYTVDDYGRLSVTLEGSGSGWYASGGKYVPITWQRGSGTSPFHYYLEDGTELELGVGRTYAAIIPNTYGGVEFS